jgi:hypothetical protein
METKRVRLGIMSEETSKKHFLYLTQKLGLKLTWEILEPGRRRSDNASAQELAE